MRRVAKFANMNNEKHELTQHKGSFSWQKYYGSEAYDAYRLADEKNIQGFQHYLSDMLYLLQTKTLQRDMVNSRLTEIEEFLNVGHGVDFAKSITDARKIYDSLVTEK